VLAEALPRRRKRGAAFAWRATLAVHGVSS
jgi:hypothetical protein